MGMNSFNPYSVGFLLAISTFCGPIFWHLQGLKKGLFGDHYRTFTFFRGIEISLYLTLVTVLRQHLFVWTVFSPKLLYLCMAVIVLNVFYSFVLLFIEKK